MMVGLVKPDRNVYLDDQDITNSNVQTFKWELVPSLEVSRKLECEDNILAILQ